MVDKPTLQTNPKVYTWFKRIFEETHEEVLCTERGKTLRYIRNRFRYEYYSSTKRKVIICIGVTTCIPILKTKCSGRKITTFKYQPLFCNTKSDSLPFWTGFAYTVHTTILHHSFSFTLSSKMKFTN